MRAEDNRTVDENGNVISKTTGKAPQKKGFALENNRKKINKGGRPKGSRNKSTLIRAQLSLDNLSGKSVKFLEALMMNDTQKLGLRGANEVPLQIRFNAAKEILNKAIANEKDKPNEGNDTSTESEEDTSPVFSLTPVKVKEK